MNRRYRKVLIQSILGGVALLCCMQVGFAFKSVLSMTVKQAANDSMLITNTELVEYTVTNTSPMTLTGIHLDSGTKPDEVTQVITNGYCSASQTLAKGASCTLGLNVRLTTAGLFTYQPTLCPDVGGGEYCTKAETAISTMGSYYGARAVLSVNKDKMVLAKGKTTTLIVQNASPSIAARNVKLVFPGEVTAGIASQTSCALIPVATGANPSTCTISVTMKNDSNVAERLGLNYSVESDNGNVIQSKVDEITSSVSIKEPPQIDQPGLYALTFQNVSANTLTLTGVVDSTTLGLVDTNAPSGVTAVMPAYCQSMAPGAICRVFVRVSDTAYGEGYLTLSYAENNVAVSKNIDVPVSGAEMTLTQADDSAIDSLTLATDQNSTVSFKIKNTGKFTLDSFNCTKSGPQSGNLSISGCPATPLAVGAEATVTLTADVELSDANGNGPLITVKPSQVDGQDVHVIVSGKWAAVEDIAKRHLSYRAIKITNNEGASVSIELTANPTISSALSSHVHFCAANDSTCLVTYKPNASPAEKICPINTSGTFNSANALANGDSCYLWFKANAKTDGFMSAATGTVTINVRLSNTNLTSKQFNMRYDNQLYLGGNFTKAGGTTVTANRIASWDGTTWHALGTGSTPGMNDKVNKLNYNGIDLYAGGDFGMASGVRAHKIARWDGTNWNKMGSTALTGAVNDILYHDGDLYVGGAFSMVAGSGGCGQVAKWNAASNAWDVYGHLSSCAPGNDLSVLSLAYWKNSLWAGTSADSQGYNLYNYYSGSWHAMKLLHGHMPEAIYALYPEVDLRDPYDQRVQLYVSWSSPSYTLSGRSDPYGIYMAGNISGGGGSGSNAPFLSTGAAYAMTTYRNQVIAGGSFTTLSNSFYSDGTPVYNGRRLFRWGTNLPLMVGSTQVGITSDSAVVYALYTYNDKLYIGGSFSTATGVSGLNNLATWNNASFARVGAIGNAGVTGGEIRSITVAPRLFNISYIQPS